MTSPAVVSSWPDAWKACYGTASFAAIPNTSAKDDSATQYVERAIMTDGKSFAASAKDFVSLFADVVVLDSPQQNIILGPGSVKNIYARVLTAKSALSLALAPVTSDDAVLTIYVSNLGQKVTVSVAGQAGVSVALEAGTVFNNVGAQIVVSSGKIKIEYLQAYDPIEMASPHFMRSLETQLRMADVSFWTDPWLSLSLSQHIFNASTDSPAGSKLSMAAAALNAMIRASIMSGPNVNYAPVLQLESYKRSLDSAIDVASAFETEYNRTVDRQANIDDQIKIWSTMIARAQDTLTTQRDLCTEAALKFENANTAVEQAQLAFKIEQRLLLAKQEIFKANLEKWKTDQILKAVFDVGMAVAMVAAAIGAAFVVPMATPTAATASVAGLSEAAKVAARLKDEYDNGKMLADTINRMRTVLEKLSSMIDVTLKLVAISKSVENNPKINPLGGSKDIDSTSDADAQALESLAVWDSWQLESDAAMSFVNGSGIDGASAFQLQLHKHAIAGKLVAQLQAQYVKAGQEYVHRLLAVSAAAADIQRLQALQQSFRGELDQVLQAQNLCYDRMMEVRTNVTLEMRKAIWAYKYLSLRKSRVTLDATKPISGLRADAAQISGEVEAWQESFSSDFASFTPQPVLLTQLLGPSAADQLAAFKRDGIATFTLARQTGDNSSTENAGPFVNGSHFRVQGMRAFLVGAKGKIGSSRAVKMVISTPGLYGDIDNQQQVSYFQSLPLTRSFQYMLSATGAAESESSVIVDSFVLAKDHVDPTPFTTWKISLTNIADLDLSSLTDIMLVWKGTADFSTTQQG